MALTDVNFQEGEGQAFLVELPAASYSGVLNDIASEPGSGQYSVMEIPAPGRIFVISE